MLAGTLIGVLVGSRMPPRMQASLTTGLGDVMDDATILAVTAAGGVILVGVALRLLDLKPVRVASFLPALLLAPFFVRLAEMVRQALAE